MLIKIPNVSQEPRSLYFCSISAHPLPSCQLTYRTGARIHQSQSANIKLVRNVQFRGAVGGRYVVMRNSEGKNNKDDDRGRKLCCRHIKLSTHSSGRASAGSKGHNSQFSPPDMSNYLSLGLNIHVSCLLPPTVQIHVNKILFFQSSQKGGTKVGNALFLQFQTHNYQIRSPN